MKSPKLDMNNVTGDLTIRNLQLDDEDDYYYFCGISDQWPKYELLRLDVFGKKMRNVTKLVLKIGIPNSKASNEKFYDIQEIILNVLEDNNLNRVMLVTILLLIYHLHNFFIFVILLPTESKNLVVQDMTIQCMF